MMYLRCVFVFLLAVLYSAPPVDAAVAFPPRYKIPPDIMDVAVSPKGRQIAYTLSNGKLMVIDAVSSRSTTLEIKGLRPGGLTWSPNGRDLVCVAERDATDHSWDLILINGATGQRRALAEHKARESDPVYSPDGLSLYFSSTRSGSSDIYRCDLKSGAVEAVVQAPYDQICPRPSPSGAKLAYISYDSGSPKVCVISLTSKDDPRKELKPADEFGPVWTIQWTPNDDDELLLTCGTAQGATVLRCDLKRDKMNRVVSMAPIPRAASQALVIPSGELNPSYAAAPIGSNALIVLDGGDAVLRRSALTLGRSLTPGLPNEASRVASDPFSGQYAIVLGKSFLLTGAVQTPGYALRFPDGDTAYGWASFLEGRGHVSQAIAIFRASLNAVSKGVPADQIRLILARLLRDRGEKPEAWALAQEVYNQKTLNAEVRRLRGQAARFMGEFALFEDGAPGTAEQWFQRASALLAATSSTSICHPQTLIAQMSASQIRTYIEAVREWREGSFSGAVKDFASLLKTAEPSDALLSECKSIFSAIEEENFLRSGEAIHGADPAFVSPELKYRARLAEAYAATEVKDAREALFWLSQARLALGDERSSRECFQRLLKQGMTDAMMDRIEQLLDEYAMDAGQFLSEGLLSAEQGRRKAFETAFIETIMLSPALKPDLVMALTADPAMRWRELLPELAEMRKALRDGRPESVARQQRFIMARLEEASQKDRNRDWGLTAMAASGLTGEARLRQGNWLDARMALETAMSYRSLATDGKPVNARRQRRQECARRYFEYLSERRSLLFNGVEASVIFADLMKDEAIAVAESSKHPDRDLSGTWLRALRNYAAYLRKEEAKEARPVIFYCMAEAYGALGFPREQVIYTLKAALATDPSRVLQETLRSRLAKEFLAQGDPFVALSFLKNGVE
ncbi:MAG: hypothetical protein NTX50_10195 [Candidatus Sumerlaeota bacterium]|nr:hypothetical protein [Candidatus Sumerlaeota bacterium]